MSRAWNGESLVTELSAALGDTSTAFQARVLGWLNDTIFDISSRHDWALHLTKGKKLLSAETEVHSLEIEAPEAPEVALAAGGSLTSGSTYYVRLTYAQANGVETLAGEESDAVTPSGANLSIELTEIPTSPESLVTERRIYLKKDSGDYVYHSTLEDNFTTNVTISTDTSSTIEPPDFESVRKLKGAPFFETGPNNYLDYKDIDQLRLTNQGAFTTGTPRYFATIDTNSLVVFPLPAEELELSFNYYRYPFKLYNSADSQPDLPIYLKPALKAGVIALGYEFRDRDGQEMKRANYENALHDAISQTGRVATIAYQVRDVYGNSNGYEVG